MIMVKTEDLAYQEIYQAVYQDIYQTTAEFLNRKIVTGFLARKIPKNERSTNLTKRLKTWQLLRINRPLLQKISLRLNKKRGK